MHWRLMVLCLAAASLIASLPVRAEPQPGGNVPASGGGQGACETNPSIPGCKEVIAAADACESDPSLPCRTVDCGAEPSQPACQGVDCSLPANADAPECAIGPDCSVPENAGLPECTDCSDPANAGRPECAGSTVLDDPCTAQDPPPEWCKPGGPQCDPATQDCTSPPFYWRNCSDTAEPCYMYMVGGPVPIMAGGTGPQHGPGPKPSPPAGRPRPPNPDCKCLLLYSPVCGKDGKTYSNACFAGCAKVRSVGACGQRSRGACWLDCQAAKAGCKCGLQWAPTCGADGNVYSNACFAKCKTAVQFACGKPPWGACKRKCLAANCVCPMIYAPVCGMDGRVYESSCQAQCLKQPVRGPCKSSRTCAKDCKAAAKPDCYCPEIYAPVCTKSGQVVANACFAECNKQVIRWPCGSRRDCAKACKAAAAPSACSCTKEVRPVCARSGALFDNPCLARCAKANVRFPCVGMTRSSCSAACKKAAAGK